jgi:lipid A 3-O-deacylase
MMPMAKHEASTGVESIVSPIKVIIVAGAAVIILIAASFANTHENDPSFITLAGGWFDFNRKHDEGAEFRLEYRSNKKIWLFKPFVTSAVASNGMTFVGAGVLVDIYLGPNWVVTPSFAVTWWQSKTKDLDLGHPIEFRSQMELAYRFKTRSRLGLSISHYSNAKLAKKNPGTEALMLNYSSPVK